jgi:hypothetical protein
MIDANGSDKVKAETQTSVSVTGNMKQEENLAPKGVYTFKCMRVVPERIEEAEAVCEQINSIPGRPWVQRLFKSNKSLLADLQAKLDAFPRYIAWQDQFAPNTVVTAGKNDMLDKYFAGSSYTATFYLGLISSVSYSAIAAGDVMSSHAGWTEAGITNAPTYSQGARPTAVWSSASAGAKALSSSLSYSITSSGTLKGAFLTTVATKDGTTGTLFSAGLFTGGDKTVASSDSVAVSYSCSM